MYKRQGATDADLRRAWADITSRLAKAPAFVEAGQKLVTRPGRLQGQTGAKQLAGAPDFLGGALTDAARAQLAGDPAALQRFTAARDALLATLAATRAYLDAHAPSWPSMPSVVARIGSKRAWVCTISCASAVSWSCTVGADQAGADRSPDTRSAIRDGRNGSIAAFMRMYGACLVGG